MVELHSNEETNWRRQNVHNPSLIVSHKYMVSTMVLVWSKPPRLPRSITQECSAYYRKRHETE